MDEATGDAPFDLGMRAHKAALEHWRAVEEACDHYNTCDEPYPCSHEVYDPSMAAYCGCEDCIVREVLAGAWSVLAPHIHLPSPPETVDPHRRTLGKEPS